MLNKLALWSSRTEAFVKSLSASCTRTQWPNQATLRSSEREPSSSNPSRSSCPHSRTNGRRERSRSCPRELSASGRPRETRWVPLRRTRTGANYLEEWLTSARKPSPAPSGRHPLIVGVAFGCIPRRSEGIFWDLKGVNVRVCRVTPRLHLRARRFHLLEVPRKLWWFIYSSSSFTDEWVMCKAGLHF